MSFFTKSKLYLELIKQTIIKKNYKIFFSQFGEDRIINELIKKIIKMVFMLMLVVIIQKNTQTHIYYIKTGGGVELILISKKIR